MFFLDRYILDLQPDECAAICVRMIFELFQSIWKVLDRLGDAED